MVLPCVAGPPAFSPRFKNVGSFQIVVVNIAKTHIFLKFLGKFLIYSHWIKAETFLKFLHYFLDPLTVHGLPRPRATLSVCVPSERGPRRAVAAVSSCLPCHVMSCREPGLLVLLFRRTQHGAWVRGGESQNRQSWSTSQEPGRAQ